MFKIYLDTHTIGSSDISDFFLQQVDIIYI